MIIPTSCRNLINFCKDVYAGNRDAIFTEIEAQGLTTAAAEALFAYPKFGLVAAVQDKFMLEKEQALNAARYQRQAGSQPAGSVEHEGDDGKGGGQPGERGQPDDGQDKAEQPEPEPTDQEKKETALNLAREKHVEAALDDMLLIVPRPTAKADFKSLFAATPLVQKRHSLAVASQAGGKARMWSNQPGTVGSMTLGRTGGPMLPKARAHGPFLHFPTRAL